LGLHLFFTQQHPMRGRIVLHLLARTKRIGAGSALFRILPQIEVLHGPGQGAVGDAMTVLVLEDLLNPDHIALSDVEDLTDDGGKLLVRGGSQGSVLPLPPQDPSDRVSRAFEDLADLPDLHSLPRKT
jgi:hypothetical protein